MLACYVLQFWYWALQIAIIEGEFEKSKSCSNIQTVD